MITLTPHVFLLTPSTLNPSVNKTLTRKVEDHSRNRASVTGKKTSVPIGLEKVLRETSVSFGTMAITGLRSWCAGLNYTCTQHSEVERVWRGHEALLPSYAAGTESRPLYRALSRTTRPTFLHSFCWKPSALSLLISSSSCPLSAAPTSTQSVQLFDYSLTHLHLFQVACVNSVFLDIISSHAIEQEILIM